MAIYKLCVSLAWTSLALAGTSHPVARCTNTKTTLAVSAPLRSTYKSLVLDRGTKSTTLNGDALPLDPREYQVLELLMRFPGKVFSVPEIVAAIEMEDDYESNPMATYVYQLRRKLRDATFIETVIGVGYRFAESDRKTRQARSLQAKDGTVFQSDAILLDLHRHEVFLDDEPVSMNHQAFRILKTLIGSPGRTCTYRQLASELNIASDEQGRALLRTHITALRNALGPPASTRIRAVWQQGYVLAL